MDHPEATHHGEHIPAIYADTFIQAGIGVIYKAVSQLWPRANETNTIFSERGPRRNHAFRQGSADTERDGDVHQREYASVAASRRPARCVRKNGAKTEGVHPFNTQAEKNCHSLAKVDAEALLEEQREIVDALARGKEHASIQQRSALRELKKNLTGLIAAGVELRKKGEKKSHLARALESDKHLHLGLSAMAQISKAFQAQHKAKEKIYKENDDREVRKKLVKLLLLHERLAKKSYHVWPQTQVQPRYLNFNATHSRTLLEAMGFDVPASYSTNNLLWWTGIFILNHEDHVSYRSEEKQRHCSTKDTWFELYCRACLRFFPKSLAIHKACCARSIVGRTLHVFVRSLVQTQKSMQNHGRLAHLLGQLHDAEQQFPCNHEQDEGSSQAAARRLLSGSGKPRCGPAALKQRSNSKHRHRRRYRAGGSRQHLSRGACCFELRSSGCSC